MPGYSASMRDIKSLCVYCGSSTGSNPKFVEATVALGELLAEQGIELIYGGGAVGLMGLIADTVMEAGGKVTGIIPTGLFPREVAHAGLTELVEVTTMHERKAMMFERSDAFIALPGGFGTLEELTEVLTWAQIGIHAKPIGVLNVDGYYDHLLAFLARAIDDGLLRRENRSFLLDHDDPAGLVNDLIYAEILAVPKWLDFNPATGAKS